MPELPEVETTRRGVLPYLEQQRIARVEVRNPHLRWPVSPEIMQLNDAEVSAVKRRGKYILIELAAGTIIVHLGMSGSLRVITDSSMPLKHDHVEMIMASGVRLRFNDPRRFGCWLWAEDWTSHALITSMGPEPLSDEFTADYLYQRARGRRTAVKAFVMDAGIVVGVGNIYANEALFMSGIDPRRAAGRISRARMAKLVACIKTVLQAAITQGGTTLRDFVNSDGQPGYFKQQLFVYGRGGQACKQCGTTLFECRQQQRATVFCKQCQR